MTSRARRRHRRSRGAPGRKILLGLLVVLAGIGIGVASFGLWVYSVSASAPSIDELKPIDKGETSFVYASDGTLLGAIRDDDVREKVSIEQIPRELERATVAIEDENFYEHHGVDAMAILRAAVENAEAGEVRQGGSTITQQLVRNLYIPDPEDTLTRKIEEATMAEEMEDEHSKRWILEQYLNTASYGTNEGRTAIGVEAAAQIYFSKTVSELTLAESALLAGLPQAPTEYNPFQSPNAALQRRNQVLRAMREEGYITRSEEDQALSAGLGLQRGYKYTTIREPYFFNFVEQDLIDRYGVNTVRKGGLKVFTTIDPHLQELAKTAVANGVASLGGPSAALVATDPSTGEIAAMASSGDPTTQQYNLAAQGHRQPGSAFKPFVLTTALKQGIDPETTIYDGSSPKVLTLPDGINTWPVNNAEGGGGGTMSVADATTNSVNVVYAQLDLDVGPENVTETAHSLGITSPLDSYPAEGIGGLRVGVSPLEMSNAYATFASGGIHHPATAIARVEFPNGDVDEPEEAEGRRAISDGIAYEVTSLLKTVLTEGTAAGQGLPSCPSAGKTGTTDEQTDAWFVGYNRELSTAVWTGYPDARVSMGSGAFGGTYAAPIWHEFMSAATPTCDDFSQPTNLPELDTLYSGHTTSKRYSSSSSDYPTSTTTTTPTGTDADGDGYPDSAYAPGVDEPPPDEPPGGGPPEGGPPGQQGD